MLEQCRMLLMIVMIVRTVTVVTILPIIIIIISKQLLVDEPRISPSLTVDPKKPVALLGSGLLMRMVFN